MNENTKKCPLCPQGCDLSNPNCGRGAEYARTGNIPQEQEKENRHGHSHVHSHPLRFEKKEQQLIMKYLHHAVNAADRGGITQDHANEMFAVLTEEETIYLTGLLEKLSEHWMKIAPNKRRIIKILRGSK